MGKARKKYFTKKITHPDSICLVGEVEGKIAGYLAGEIGKAEGWRPVIRTELDNIFVEEEFRSRGVGKALVLEFLKWSREKGVKLAIVNAYSSNDEAIRFYKRENFSPYSLRLEIGV